MNLILSVLMFISSALAEEKWDAVKPIFQERCADCHDTRVSPEFSTCASAQKYASRIKGYILELHAPIFESRPEYQPNEKETETIINWIESGASCAKPGNTVK